MKYAQFVKQVAASMAVGAVLLLAGCGGGGSSEPVVAQQQQQQEQQQPAPVIATGQFIDAAVQGLAYSSGNTTGTTDASGNFQYEVGQNVAFSVGGIALGSVAPKGVITPVDLVAGATDETNAVVTNISKFLQTIDEDNNPANGITISTAAVTAAQGLSIDFAQSTADFAADVDVTAAISAITTATATGERALISTAAAQAHLKSNLLGLLAGTYSGTFSGDSSGTFTVTINKAGVVSGSGVDKGVTFPINGQVQSNGKGAFGSAGVATFNAAINPDTGVITGTWAWDGASGGGTLSGSK